MAREKRVKDKVVGQVYETSDLSKFKFIKGNRLVSENRKLRKDIEEKGKILEPIKVNKNMEVTDGQHRITIARELGLSVPYIFNEDSTNSIIEINNTHKPWVITDYIHSYTATGNKEYVRLTNLLKKYPALRISKTAQQAVGDSKLHSRGNEIIKQGNFKFRNYAEFTKYAKAYQSFINTTKMASNSYVQDAYFKLYVLAPFNNTRFIKKVIARDLSEQLKGVTNLPRILQAFIEANNSGLKVQSKNWISLSMDEVGIGHLNNDYNEKLVDGTPTAKLK